MKFLVVGAAGGTGREVIKQALARGHTVTALVRRFVCETSLGQGDSVGHMGLSYTLFVIPIILPFYFWDKRRQETLIRSSSLDWMIVRPGAMNNRRGRGVYKHGVRIGSWI
jgi:uncharacterized protein YbjT (DUF2867 family)